MTLLSEMWKHQQVAAFFTMYGKQVPVFDSSDNKMREEAIQTIKSGYIDYFFGRAIKPRRKSIHWRMTVMQDTARFNRSSIVCYASTVPNK